MGLVRSKGTKPEMIVRRLVHSLGYRYRLHDRTLPGHPDLVLNRSLIGLPAHHCSIVVKSPVFLSETEPLDCD